MKGGMSDLIKTILLFVVFILTAAALFTLLLLPFIKSIEKSVEKQNNAACSEFSNYSVKNIPARCAKEYGL